MSPRRGPSVGEFAREKELILRCAHAGPTSVAPGWVAESILNDFSWNYVINLSNIHGVTALLHRNLGSVPPGAIPAGVLATLDDHFLATALRSLAQTRALLTIMTVFEAAGILAAPFKGPSLAIAAYGDLLLRESGDLDILVEGRDFDRSIGVALSLGYLPVSRRYHDHHAVAPERTSRPNDFALKYDVLLVNRANPRQPIALEIHSRLMPRYFSSFPRDDAAFWSRLRPVPLGPGTVKCMDNEFNFVYICLHSSKHCWCKLLWVCDLAELIRSDPGLDWDRVRSEAKAVGGLRMVGVGLCLASDLLGASPPAPLMRLIRSDPIAIHLSEIAAARLFRPERGGTLIERFVRSQLPLTGHSIEDIWFHIHAMERLLDRVRYFMGLAAGIVLEITRRDLLMGRIRWCLGLSGRRYAEPS